MKKDPAIVRAERLRAVMAMPEYKQTVEAWILDAFNDALHQMESAKEVYEFHRAQGAYSSLKALKDQFDQVFVAERAALERLNKKRGE